EANRVRKITPSGIRTEIDGIWRSFAAPGPGLEPRLETSWRNLMSRLISSYSDIPQLPGSAVDLGLDAWLSSVAAAPLHALFQEEETVPAEPAHPTADGA